MFPSGELVFRAAESSIPDLGNGSFARQIIVLALAEPNSPGNRAFIAKVLAAANLDLSDDAFYAEIPCDQPVNCFTGMNDRPKFILVFGLSPAQVGLQAAAPAYQPIQLHGATWLFADALSVLEPDRDKKGKLWTVLKTLFL